MSQAVPEAGEPTTRSTPADLEGRGSSIGGTPRGAGLLLARYDPTAGPPTTGAVDRARRRASRRGFGADRIAMCLFLLVTLAACGPAEAPPPATTDPALAALGTPAGRFAGSESCKPCHPAQYASWSASRHRATLRLVTGEMGPHLAGLGLEGGFEVGKSGLARGPDPEGKELSVTPAYLVGGKHREDLCVRMEDGRLQVFPYSYDFDAGAPFRPLRELAGGVDPPPDSLAYWTRIGRNADLTCYGCHATGSRLEIGRAASGAYAVPLSRWAEAGVGCEACHGVGGPHVAAAAAGRGASVVPSGLSPRASAETRIAICASCHAMREYLSSPFGATPIQACGVPPWDRADPLLRRAPDEEFEVFLFADLRPATYQQEAIALGQSECARRGGLTCDRCHDPHGGGLRPSARGSAACLPCHDSIAAVAEKHSRHKAGTPGVGCIDCHMAAILRGPGRNPARDHTLAPPVAGTGEVPAACAACHKKKEDSAKVIRGWSLFPQRSAETRRRLALSAARADAEKGERRAFSSLAAIAADAGQGWFVRYSAATWIEALARQLGSDAGAAASLRVALEDPNPALKRAAVRGLGRLSRSEDVPRLSALVSSPDPFLALDAVSALGIMGVPDYRTRLAQLVRRPDLAGEFRAQLAVGRAALLASDWPMARAALHRALELDPFVVVALNDLGIALYREGMLPQAREMWSRVLDLDPRFEAARKNLEETAAEPPRKSP